MTFPLTSIYERIIERGVADKRGDDAFRFAVHEAAHGLDADADDWSSDALHAALTEQFDGPALWVAEVRARCVEQAVCAAFGVETDSIEQWLHISAIEAIRFGLPFAKQSEFVVDDVAHDPYTRKLIERILTRDF